MHWFLLKSYAMHTHTQHFRSTNEIKPMDQKVIKPADGTRSAMEKRSFYFSMRTPCACGFVCIFIAYRRPPNWMCWILIAEATTVRLGHIRVLMVLRILFRPQETDRCGPKHWTPSPHQWSVACDACARYMHVYLTWIRLTFADDWRYLCAYAINPFGEHISLASHLCQCVCLGFCIVHCIYTSSRARVAALPALQSPCSYRWSLHLLAGASACARAISACISAPY